MKNIHLTPLVDDKYLKYITTIWAKRIRVKVAVNIEAKDFTKYF